MPLCRILGTLSRKGSSGRQTLLVSFSDLPGNTATTNPYYLTDSKRVFPFAKLYIFPSKYRSSFRDISSNINLLKMQTYPKNAHFMIFQET